MKFQKFLSTITPIGIFGSALVGMIMLIVGAESGTPELMMAGGIVIGVGIGVIAILNVIFKRISPSLEKQLGLDKYVDAATDIDDDDDDEVSDAHYEAILSTRLQTRTVTDVFDREDALNALMERSEMNGLRQHYEEEADKLWDDYEGEDKSDTVDKLYELIDRYYGMYKQALPYFNKSQESGAPPEEDKKQNSISYDHEVVKREEKKEEIKLRAYDKEIVEEAEEQEQKDEVNLRTNDYELDNNEAEPYTPPVIEPPITPEPIKPAQPTQRPGAAVGYKPMKKK